jgi:hypothetical protein
VASCLKELEAGPLQHGGSTAAPSAAALPPGLDSLARRADGAWRYAAAAAAQALRSTSRMQQ